MFYGRKCKIFKAVMPIKSYHKKLNFVKKLDKIESFVAVFVKEFVNQNDKKINTDFCQTYQVFKS
jgi:hypothetical protein